MKNETTLKRQKVAPRLPVHLPRVRQEAHSVRARKGSAPGVHAMRGGAATQGSRPPLRHIDLFSGIGGFALAAEWAFGNVEHLFCDNDPFAQAVLKKHWPEAPIYADIRSLTADADRQRQLQPEGGKQGEREWAGNVDLLTGGFPCQPFSAAGRRKGTEDDRHLWPEMLRVIREFNPRWIIAENVGGLITWSGGLVLEQVHTDLEAAGYEVQAFVIPAVAVGAPHRRDRVWIIAHALGSDALGDAGAFSGAKEKARLQERNEVGQLGKPSGVRDDAANSSGSRWRKGNTKRSGPRKRTSPQEKRGRFTHSGGTWDEDWPAAAARLCALDDGLPGGLARPRGWRNAALKGAGNAIVPQVAAEIMAIIKEIEND